MRAGITWSASRTLTARRTSAVALAGMLLLALVASAAPARSATTSAAVDNPALQPVDPQNWVDMEDLTWDDYVPVPGKPAGWTDGSIRGSEFDFKGAVVLLEFEDQPFLITQEAETHPFGNPQPGWEPVASEDAAEWFKDYLNTPNEFNAGQTTTGYWMETSHGKISVEITAFGPYELPGKLHEYGLSGFGRPVGNQADSVCPAGDTCGKNLRNDGFAAWRAAEGEDIASQFDTLFWTTAGHDESSTWQEFGEMLFQTRDDIPAEFGPPGAEDGPVLNNAGNPITNWAGTRYVEWTSWQAAANHWPNASGQGGLPNSTQAESTGSSVYAHEFSHLLSLPDNYNNPFAGNIRNYSGYWEMMSRGTFNGPGGTHNRWQVPNQGGAALGPHHTVRHKRALGVYDDGDLLELQRDDLADQGVAVTTVKARSSVPDGDHVGINVAFGTTTANGQNLRTCAALGHTGANSFWCHGNNNYHNFTVEVVDRVGNDSFTPGHGVLIALSRNTNTQPNVWLMDPNPEDIGMIDFYRPDGTPVPVVPGDPRQLNNATFHAGTDSGSDYEFVDEHNRLHFYILDTSRDEDGVLHYDIGVRRLDGAGDFERGLALGDAQRLPVDPTTAALQLPLTNTGEAGEGVFDSDVYRISSSVDGAGWDVWQPHEIAAAAAGETIPVEVYATRAPGAAGSAAVTVTATSESDPSKTATVTVQVQAPEVLVSSAASLVDSMRLHNGTANPLQNQLRNALRQLAAGEQEEACSALSQFLHLVDVREGQRNGLTSAQAEQLRDAAAAIDVATACGG